MSPSTGVTFGLFLKQLRKRAGMTQADLAAAVGYSIPFLSNLELNQRLPAVQMVAQQFIPALGLQDEPQLAAQLVELAAAARGERPPATITLHRETRLVVQEERATLPPTWPAPPTDLVGRAQEIKTICNRLLGHSGRLLTLVGPPGIGKTRLGLAVADTLQLAYPDGVYFAPLAAIGDAELVASTLAALFGLSDQGQRPSQTKLIEFLRRKELLLLLDNFEQITAAAQLVAELLAACPGLRLLVTSRERLHLRAEQRYRVPPLGQDAAVSLFVQRAQSVEAEFRLTPDNQPILAEICRHLDCLPLAIELSAARVDLFTPSAMLARLQDHRLDLLSDEPRDLPARQRTLRNAIQSSYGLLDERQRRCFGRLGVFVGGFEQTAVAQLGIEEETLQTLINKSLVQVAVVNDQTRRFRLLETLRDYAWEQLGGAGEAAAMQRLHAEAYLQLAEQAARHLRDAAQAHWLERLAVEHDNLRAALAWALANQQAEIGARLGIGLWNFWYIRGYYAEGWRWLEQLLTLADQPEQRANLLYGRGMLARRRGDNTEAAASFAASVAVFRQLDDPRGIASALRGLGMIHYLQYDYATARPHFEEALALFRRLGDQDGIAVTLDNLAYISSDANEVQRLHEESLAIRRRSGNLHGITFSLAGLAYHAIEQGDYVNARLYAQEQRQINEVLGNQNGLANALVILGLIAYAEADYPGAQLLYEQSLQLCQQSGDRSLLSAPILSLGMTAWKCGEYDRARLLFEQGLALDKEIGNFANTAKVFELLAALALARGQAQRALCLAGVAAAICEPLHIKHVRPFRLEFERTHAAARQLLSEEEAAAAWAAGQALSMEQAIAYALGKSALEVSKQEVQNDHDESYAVS